MPFVCERNILAMRCASLCVGESDSRREGLPGSEKAEFSVESE